MTMHPTGRTDSPRSRPHTTPDPRRDHPATDPDPGLPQAIQEGEDDVPTRCLSATLTLQIRATLATRDCTGRERTDLLRELCDALEVGITEDVPYDLDNREPTDLIQDIHVRIHPQDQPDPRRRARERFTATQDAATALVRDGLGLGERDADLLDLVTAATRCLSREPGMTLDQVIEAAYEQTPDQVRRWWSGWA